MSVCVAYRKGWDSGVEKMRAEQNQVIIETHTQKTEIESEIAKKTGVKFLPSDFKKRDGYIRSIKLSKEYELYRQNYCGCEFSKRKEKED